MTTSLTPVNPFGSIIEGLRLGATIEDRELARQKREQEAFAMEKAQEQERIGLMAQQRFVEDPTYENLIGFVPYLNPQAAKVMQESVAAIGKDRARNQLQSIFPAVVAIKKGNPEVANNVLDQIIQGTQNQTSKAQLENLKQILNFNPNFFLASVALTAHESGLSDLAKQLLEFGKKQEFRILTPEEQARLLGPGATGVYGVGSDGKPVLIVPEREGFTALTPEEYRNLGIDPKNAFAQRNNKTGKIDVTNLRPIAEAKATTEVKIGEKAETKVLESQAKVVDRLVQNATALTDFANISQDLAEIYRGLGGGVPAELGARLRNVLGIESKEARAFAVGEALRAKFAPTLRVEGSGSTTDREMSQYLQALPSLSTTEKGRELMAKYAKKIAERQRKVADFASRALKEKSAVYLGEIQEYEQGLGSIFDEDIRSYLTPVRAGSPYPGPAPAAAPVPAPAPLSVAPGRPAAGPPGPPARRPGDKGRDIGGGFRVLTQ